MIKGVSLNIGSNDSKENANGRGRINPIDWTFQYLPIPETKQVKINVPTYAELQACPYTQLKAPSLPVHLDPEFSTNTYGHATRGYGDIKALSDPVVGLKPGDYLFFHATLSHLSEPSLWLTAIIGYFIIESVNDCRKRTKEEIEERYGKRFASNAHLKRTDPSIALLISGSNESKLLRCGIPLSNFSEPTRLNEKFKDNIRTVTDKQLDIGKPWYRWTLKINHPEAVIESGEI